jgi:ribosomal protein S18 acetylase RimI-like enzyme
MHHATQAAVCDVLEPWAHGTIVRATRFPTYFDFNVVRVEDDPGMNAEALAAFADEALEGLAHRRVDIEDVDVAERLRPEFEALGWLAQRLVWMRHEESPPPAVRRIAVEEVPHEAVDELRVAWLREDFPDLQLGDHLAEAREVGRLRGAKVIAVQEAGEPIAYAQIESDGRSAEIAQVYVHRDHRGRGLGTAVTRAGIEAAGEAEDLWIVADDEGRPKELYARLGFRPVWRSAELLRLPLTVGPPALSVAGPHADR